MDQLKKLGELRDAGVLTPEELEAKKADLLVGSNRIGDLEAAPGIEPGYRDLQPQEDRPDPSDQDGSTTPEQDV